MEFGVKVDPVLTTTSNSKFIIDKSATQITNQIYTCENFSSSQIAFNITALNEQTIVSRKIFVTLTADFTLRSVSGLGPIFPTGDMAGVCALRYMPLQSVTNTLGVQINNLQVTTNPIIYNEAFCRFGYDKQDRSTYQSLFPCMQDVASDYSDSYNTNQNPLGLIFDNDTQQPRGAFEPVIISDNPLTGVAVLRFSWVEQIVLCPPLNGSAKRDRFGFRGLQSLNIVFTLGDLSRMLSYDNVNGTALASVSAVFPQGLPPTVNLQWFSPPFRVNFADTFLFPYSQIFYQQTDIGAISSGATLNNISSNSYQLTAIPSKIYIFAKKRQGDLTAFDSDCYAYISNINVSFGNQNGLLANYPESLIYQNFCARNGWKQPFRITKTRLGNVIALDLGTDLPMPLELASGLRINTLFQVTLTLTNLSNALINYSLFVVPIYDGILAISNASVSTSVNILTTEDILQADVISAQQSQPMTHLELALEGGDLLGSLKKFASNVGHGFNRAKEFYGNNREAIHRAIQAGKSLGESAVSLLPLLLAAGLTNDASIDILAGAGYSAIELSQCAQGGCMGGRLISNPESLLSGGGFNSNNYNYNNFGLNKKFKSRSLYGRN